jgi:DNA-binding response OmpR family regulator
VFSPESKERDMIVLMVEDDMRTAGFVTKGLRQAGYQVQHAADGMSGLALACSTPFDAAIIDIMLPKLDGITLIQHMRQRGVRTPVIVLSAKRSVDDRITGLQAGGDDYLVKPFSFSELLARVQALIRRASHIPESPTLEYEGLSLDTRRRKVTRDGQRIELQPKEFELLEYLMRNAGRVVSKTMIMEHVWDYDFDPQTNVVEARVCRLRGKIDKDFGKPLIHTVRGVGYVLE